MKIVSLRVFNSAIVDTDKRFWPTYRRFRNGEWACKVDEVWEPVSGREELDLEKEFQTWIQTHTKGEIVDLVFGEASTMYSRV